MTTTRLIRFALCEDTTVGVLPARGSIHVTATRPRVNGATITIPRTSRWSVRDGAPTEEFRLGVTGPDWAWDVMIVDHRASLILRRLVAIPDGSEPLNFDDLPLVDRRSISRSSQ